MRAGEGEAYEAALAVFGPGGRLSRALDGFEFRPPQVEMAACLWRVFAQGLVAMVEAGTGTGKSLAYLYPGLIEARRAGRPLVISTNTINLQEQLLAKDLPLLATLVETPPRVALLMGRQNYLCLRRWQQVQHRGIPGLSPKLAGALNQVVATGRGERGRLGFAISEEVWSQIQAEGELCLRQRCPAASGCFWQTARRAAAQAEIILVNHHLLLADAAIRQDAGWDTEYAVLPNYDRLVCDEAHHLEEIATEYFSLRLSRDRLNKALNRLNHHDGPALLGILPMMRFGLPTSGRPLESAKAAEARILIEQALAETKQVKTWTEEFFTRLAGLVRQHGSQDKGGWQWRYREDLGQYSPEISSLAFDLGLSTRVLAGTLGRLLDTWEARPEAPETEEGLILQAVCQEVGNLGRNLPMVLSAEDRQQVYWLEAGSHGDVAAIMAPLDIGPVFHGALIKNLHSAVFTSATLSVAGDFTFLRERLGLDRVHPTGRCELAAASPFNYQQQVLLAAPLDLPGPDERDFPRRAAAFLREVLAGNAGRTLVLFTAHAALDSVYRTLQPELPPGRQLFRQGEKPRSDLLVDFACTPGAVLFGTDSFWEGIDLPGLSLSCVILARLPFRVPTEPVTAARLERLESDGINPFRQYTLPQAIIKLKQGFGRLIRRGDDFGAVIILDQRLFSRFYGREFHAALPPCTECFGPAEEVARTVGEWLNRGNGARVLPEDRING